jgi:PASTA domain
MNRRLSRITLLAGLTGFALVSTASVSSANTSQIGSNLNFPSLPALCTGCVGVQNGNSQGLSTFPFKSPANGVIVSWSVRSGDVGASYALRILRQGGPTAFQSVGRSPAPGPITSATDAVHTYTASLPISFGDNIGVEVDAGHSLPDHYTGNNADISAYANTFPDGTAATFTGTPQHELLLQATVKYCLVPNVHKQKKVNAKQALAAADCGVKIKKKETHKKKFRGKVLKQKKPAGLTLPPGTVVPIVIGQK